MNSVLIGLISYNSVLSKSLTRRAARPTFPSATSSSRGGSLSRLAPRPGVSQGSEAGNDWRNDNVLQTARCQMKLQLDPPDQLNRLSQRLGVNHIVASIHWPGMPNSLALEQLHRLAEEVWPLLHSGA